MLLSMTGFGDARQEWDTLVVAIEVRTVNNRYLKVTTRSPEGFSALESAIENAVRKRIRRGTVQADVRLARLDQAAGFRIDEQVLAAYQQQLETLARRWPGAEPVRLDSLLALPGVVPAEPAIAADAGQLSNLVLEVLDAALVKLTKMRTQEGAAIAADLRGHRRSVAEQLDQIAARAPRVVADYRERLAERVRKSLGELNVSVEPAELVREVSLFGERSDISEEIARLRSHLQQFDQLLEGAESTGRKLDFLSQEMYRESNTIGAKANDAEIAHQVVEMKAAIERIREQVQNVE